MTDLAWKFPVARAIRADCPRRGQARRPAFESMEPRALLTGSSITAHVSPFFAGFAGASTRFQATFSDSGAAPGGAVIDWGDGSHSVVGVATIDYVPGATGDPYGVSGTHTYARPGNFPITATILDANGLAGQVTSSASIEVVDPFPTIMPPALPGPVLTLTPGVYFSTMRSPDLATAEVTALYNIALGRAPDAPGLAANVALVKAGTPIGSVASAFLHSAEFDADLVASDYQEELGRSGSPSEVAAWVGRMQQGMTAEQVKSAFLASAEFNAATPTDSAFVVDLYEDALRRAPAPSEVASWTSAIASGLSRAEVVTDVLDSQEAETTSVKDLYTVILQRPADPTGLSIDAAALQGGVPQVDLAATLLGSDEFAGLAQKAVK